LSRAFEQTLTVDELRDKIDDAESALRPVDRSASFDHLVGAGAERGKEFEAERLRCLQVYDKLELYDLLHRQICGL
jgi:hypothetical protein